MVENVEKEVLMIFAKAQRKRGVISYHSYSEHDEQIGLWSRLIKKGEDQDDYQYRNQSRRQVHASAVGSPGRSINL